MSILKRVRLKLTWQFGSQSVAICCSSPRSSLDKVSYLVENLTDLITIAMKAWFALSIVLLLIAAVTLLVSGVGIMNIMLSAVDVPTRDRHSEGVW